MRFLAAAINGLSGINGLTSSNGLSGMNGLTSGNGLQGMNGVRSNNGLSTINGTPTNNGLIGADGTNQKGWSSFFLPIHFTQAVLKDNAIDSSLLGPLGVGDLSAVPGIENNVLDNRFISEELKVMLCHQEETGTNGEITFRNYFSVLIDLAWPSNAEFWLCCSEPAGASASSACLKPDHVFSSVPEVEGLEPLEFAPHFLTGMFETGQQEALTAALIAKFNVHGKTLLMDLTGRFDLGPAGTRFIGGKIPGFDHYLGNAWGNMFLDCNGVDKNNVICKASMEEDRTLGRDPEFYNLPMFTCSGQSEYPTLESGKACFSKDMETNKEDGCGWVAAAGPCNQVCVGGFCGANDPPIEERGTTNVLYIYMQDYHAEDENNGINDGEDDGSLALKIALPLAALFVVGSAFLAFLKHQNGKAAAKTAEEATSEKAEVGTESGTGIEEDGDLEDVDTRIEL